MTDSIATNTLPAATAGPVRSGGAAVAAFALLAGFIGLLVVSYRSFQILPVGDDFPYVHEINRGQADGPLALLTRSWTYQTYRPLTSLSIWAAGRGPVEGRAFRLRLLGYASLAVYGAVAVMWVTRMRLGGAGAWVAILALLFHPTIPASLCSIDGFNALLSSAALWLGAWVVWRWDDRPSLAAIGVFLIFLIGAGFKEYVFALVPLSAWTALCVTERRSWRYALTVVIAAGIAFLIVLDLRHFAMPPGPGAHDYVAINPAAWVQNAALFAIGLLFVGNSVWCYVRQDALAYAAVGGSALLVCGITALGLRRWIASAPVASPSPTAASTARPRIRWVIFLLGALVITTFPAILTKRISEMYLPPLLLPFALVLALAADGLRSAPSRILQWAVVTIAIVGLVICAITIHAKTDDMVELGRRADQQLRQILAMLPPNAHDLRIATLFDPSQLPPRRSYSVYRMGDDTLLVHSMCFDWLVPQRHLVLGWFLVGDPTFDPRSFDVILRWNAAAKRFEQDRSGAAA